MNLTERIDRVAMLVQNQLATMNNGYVRIVASTELMDDESAE